MFEVYVTKSNRQENHLVLYQYEGLLSSSYKLYWSYNPIKIVTEENYIMDVTEVPVVFKSPKNTEKKRVYFQLVEENEQKVTVLGQRILPVDNMLNFRDMGGYPTKDGRHVKWGLLYRSDYFWLLEDESLPYVENLGIKTIIDYRGQDEIDERPNRAIGEDQTVLCDPKAATAAMSGVLQTGDASKSAEELMYEQAVKETKLSANAGTEKMLDQQRRFVNEEVSRSVFSKSLKTIAKTSNSPVVQHCRGGKDRTGYGCMLLLSALGVEEEFVIHDYMLTKFARKERSELLYNKYKEMYDNEAVVNYLYSFFDIQEAFIQASISEIKKDYSSILQYIETELNISKEEIEIMRDYYLE